MAILNQATKDWILKHTAKWDTTEYNCDGCGEVSPITHLDYIEIWDGHFCDRCSASEEDE